MRFSLSPSAPLPRSLTFSLSKVKKEKKEKKNLPNEFEWVLNPFAESIKMHHIPISLQEQLIDMREDGNLKVNFEQNLCIIGGWH